MKISQIARLITEEPDVPIGYRNYDNLLADFNKHAARLGLETDAIGKVDGLPIMLAKPAKMTDGLNNILILGGFHGEEPAAVLGIMDFLKRAPQNILGYINASVIPTINPYGFANATRYGRSGVPTNQVYDGNKFNPSDNCKLLIDNDDLIRGLSRNGLLDLHENTDLDDEFYLYAYVSDDGGDYAPSRNLTDIARQTAKRHFRQRPDGHYKDTNPGKAEYDVKNGVVWNSRDGSYDDYIGANPLLILETPAKDDNKLNERISAHVDLIESIVSHLGVDSSDTELLALPNAHQTTGCSCGGACLRSILRYYGVDIPEHRVNDLAEISRDGIDPDMIAATAAKFGLKSKIYRDWNTRGIREFLDKKIPVIVGIVAWGDDSKDYTKDEDGHYVVAIGHDKCRVYFEDPSIKDTENSRGYLDWREFYHRWHDMDGKMIAIPIWSERGIHKAIPKSGIKTIRIP